MLLWWWQCGVNSLQQKKNKHETITLHTTIGVQFSAKMMINAIMAHARNIAAGGMRERVFTRPGSIQMAHFSLRVTRMLDVLCAK
jgi:hypothetical protein